MDAGHPRREHHQPKREFIIFFSRNFSFPYGNKKKRICFFYKKTFPNGNDSLDFSLFCIILFPNGNEKNSMEMIYGT